VSIPDPPAPAQAVSVDPLQTMSVFVPELPFPPAEVPPGPPAPTVIEETTLVAAQNHSKYSPCPPAAAADSVTLTPAFAPPPPPPPARPENFTIAVCACKAKFAIVPALFQ
jgi:hypothetical protein